MLLHHGTGLALEPLIAREGLRGRGRPVFLVETVEGARRYARARTARAFLEGGEPVGVVVSVEVGGVESDPWSAAGEPGQYRAREDVEPWAITGVVRVRFPWICLGHRAVLPSPSLAAGLADALALEHAHADGQERWAPQDVETVSGDLAALNALMRSR